MISHPKANLRHLRALCKHRPSIDDECLRVLRRSSLVCVSSVNTNHERTFLPCARDANACHSAVIEAEHNPRHSREGLLPFKALER
jgi:hypothetical protein